MSSSIRVSLISTGGLDLRTVWLTSAIDSPATWRSASRARSSGSSRSRAAISASSAGGSAAGAAGGRSGDFELGRGRTAGIPASRQVRRLGRSERAQPRAECLGRALAAQAGPGVEPGSLGGDGRSRGVAHDDEGNPRHLLVVQTDEAGERRGVTLRGTSNQLLRGILGSGRAGACHASVFVPSKAVDCLPPRGGDRHGVGASGRWRECAPKVGPTSSRSASPVPSAASETRVSAKSGRLTRVAMIPDPSGR